MARKYRTSTEAAFQDLYRQQVKSAKRRGIDWNLTKSEFRKLIKRPCKYCGQLPSQRYKHGRKSRGSILYSGLDRVSSDGAYEAANVVPACKFCNSGKGTRSPEHFALHITQIVQHALTRLIGVELPRYELLEEIAAPGPSQPSDAEGAQPSRSRKQKPD